jgi:type IV pilus assembly protein PilE
MRETGYTLIEVVITVMVLSILAAMAVNSFSNYIRRARAADAIEQLDLYRTRMEKAFNNNANYGIGACAVALPNGVQQFGFSCTLAGDSQSYTARATGAGSMSGYEFSIDDRGMRRTEAFPGVAAAADCFMVEKDKCR